VYRQKNPALFLSSFSDFFVEHKNEVFVKKTVKNGFDKLIKTYILPLKNKYPDAPVYFAGSIADSFNEYLKEAALENGISIENVIKEPINNLLNYYSNKN